jgi:hypothetical protein
LSRGVNEQCASFPHCLVVSECRVVDVRFALLEIFEVYCASLVGGQVLKCRVGNRYPITVRAEEAVAVKRLR